MESKLGRDRTERLSNRAVMRAPKNEMKGRLLRMGEGLRTGKERRKRGGVTGRGREAGWEGPREWMTTIQKRD